MQNYVANVNNGTTIAQNTVVFGTNLLTTAGLVGADTPHKFRVIVALSTASGVLNITIDGTHYYALNSGQALGQNDIYEFDIDGLLSTDSINFQFSNSSGATIGIFRVIDIINEG